MLTDDDHKLLAEIMNEEDSSVLSEKIRAYYGDIARADRTPRAILYVHIGILCGRMARLTGSSRAY